MKKLLRKNSYLIQTIMYKIASRLFLGVVFSLIWNHFTNKNKAYTIVENAFFFVGVILLTMAWFNYLKLDGLSISKARKDNKRKDKSFYKSKNILDFLEEEVTSHQMEDDDDDEILSSMMANILTGICFLIPSIIFTYL